MYVYTYNNKHSYTYVIVNHEFLGIITGNHP